MNKDQIETVIAQTAVKIYQIADTHFSKVALPLIQAELRQLVKLVDTIDPQPGEETAPGNSPA